MGARHAVGKFVAELEARRRRAGLTHRAFAARLGCHEAVWSRVKDGKRGVSLDLAQKAIRLWPELRDEYASELLPPVPPSSSPKTTAAPAATGQKGG